jgi:hypothetical protein
MKWYRLPEYVLNYVRIYKPEEQINLDSQLKFEPSIWTSLLLNLNNNYGHNI